MQKLNLFFGLGALALTNAALAADTEHQGGPLANLDTNSDGFVDFVEFQENSRDPVARLDSDADGELTLDEFLSGRPGPGQGRGGFGGRRGGPGGLSEEQIAEFEEMMLERATTQFTEMDLDGNGLVSTLEFQEATFLRMDDDNDGVLSAAELRRRGPGGPGRGGRGERGERGGQRGGPGPYSQGQSGQQ